MSSSTKLDGFGGRRMAKRSWKTGAVWPVDAWAFLSASGSVAPAIETLPLILPGLSRDIHLSVLAFLVARRVRFRRIWFSRRLSQDGRLFRWILLGAGSPIFFFWFSFSCAAPPHLLITSAYNLFPLVTSSPTDQAHEEGRNHRQVRCPLRCFAQEDVSPWPSSVRIAIRPTDRCLPARWLCCLA